MGTVNADLAELAQLIQHMQAAASQTSHAKRSLQQKCQQLGGAWHDAKYEELEAIVQDCAGALNKVEHALLDGAKTLTVLLKALQEYDAVNFNGNGAARSAAIGLFLNRAINSLSPEVRAWASKLNQLSNWLCQVYTAKYAGIISQEKLNRPLSETVSYEVPAMFALRGMDRNVLGYNDGRSSHIAVGTGHELQTTVHENLHQLSANGPNHGIITTSGGQRQNVQLNEAITELLTQRTLGNSYGQDYSAYTDNRNAMALLESAMGEDTVSHAYFQNRPELMQQSFDNALGPGHWEQLSEAFDDCLHDDSWTRASGRVRRDDLINRYILAVNRANGGSQSWSDLLS